ncbi:hypothetical protein ACRAWG_31545 [Methylobacterium sp. P31]
MMLATVNHFNKSALMWISLPKIFFDFTSTSSKISPSFAPFCFSIVRPGVDAALVPIPLFEFEALRSQKAAQIPMRNEGGSPSMVREGWGLGMRRGGRNGLHRCRKRTVADRTSWSVLNGAQANSASAI